MKILLIVCCSLYFLLQILTFVTYKRRISRIVSQHWKDALSSEDDEVKYFELKRLHDLIMCLPSDCFDSHKRVDKEFQKYSSEYEERFGSVE